jgi:hypothetical protein
MTQKETKKRSNEMQMYKHANSEETNSKSTKSREA